MSRPWHIPFYTSSLCILMNPLHGTSIAPESLSMLCDLICSHLLLRRCIAVSRGCRQNCWQMPQQPSHMQSLGLEIQLTGVQDVGAIVATRVAMGLSLLWKLHILSPLEVMSHCHCPHPPEWPLSWKATEWQWTERRAQHPSFLHSFLAKFFLDTRADKPCSSNIQVTCHLSLSCAI